MQGGNRGPMSGESSEGLPPVQEILAGLWSLPLPIPDNPLRYVIVYAFEVEPDGLVLVDAGVDAPVAFDSLVAGLGHLGASVTDIRGILVTHIHPDHYGLADRLRELSGAWVALHPADADLILSNAEDAARLLRRNSSWLRQAGVPEAEIARLQESSLDMVSFTRVGRPDILLTDGDRPSLPGWDLVAVHTPGHTPGHLCFYEAGRDLLLSGDHVLPRITPNVGAYPPSGDRPLDDFLNSLERVRRYSTAQVLPAHEWAFAGLPDRVDALLAHHEERLDAVEKLVTLDGATTWDVARSLEWSRPWSQIHDFMRWAALGEVHAHLLLLEGRRRITSHRRTHGSHLWRRRVRD